MDYQIHVNLPYSHLGLLFLFYYVLFHTSLPRQGAHFFRSFAQNKAEAETDEEVESDEEVEADEEVESDEEVEEQKEDLKVVEELKFEEKYLTSFKSFSNAYFFFEEELLEKVVKREQLVEEYNTSYIADLDNLTVLLLQTTYIVDLLKTDNLEDAQIHKELIKYFELDLDLDLDFDELINDLKNDHNRFTSELNNLLESTISETEFDDKALQYVLDKKLDGFINNYILEYTPLGNVYMRYNNFKKSFEYFSNNTIPYRYLEAIGRKYVMTFRCKALFVDLEEELKKASEKDKLEQDKKALDKDVVVSKFKRYNKDLKIAKNMTSRPGQNNRELISKANLPVLSTTGEKQLFKENANRYTWEGRLANFSILKKVDRKIVDKNYALSFADFKQMSQIKK